MAHYSIWIYPLISLWLCQHVSAAIYMIEYRPRCHKQSTDCLYIDVEKLKNATIFHVNDTNINVTNNENQEIKYDCFGTNRTIDDESLPKLDRAVNSANVSILDCIPPTGSYKDALVTLNITGVRHLEIWYTYCMDNNTFNNFVAHNFENFAELESLNITCFVFEIEYFDLSFLRPLKNLKHLRLAGMKIPPMPSWIRIPSLTLISTDPLQMLQPWGGCDNLETLLIQYWSPIRLPDSWLAHCPHLTSVRLKDFLELKDLPQRMLNSTSLQILEINDSGLFKLPKDLLIYAQNLRVLHLLNNRLSDLPRNIISSLSLLEELDLSGNRFQLDVLQQLEPLKHLRSLFLDRLPFSNNVCKLTSVDNENSVTSPWPLLPALERLTLRYTGTENICKTWSQTLPLLKLLDLTHVHLTELRFEDIQYIQSNSLEVDLRETKFEAIVYGKDDYEAILKDPHSDNHNASIWLDSSLDCDCRWYWFLRALQERPGHFEISGLQCRIKRESGTDLVPLKNIKPETLTCRIVCERDCECYRRIHDSTTLVNCTGAGLSRVPQLLNLREIHMANNRIEELDINYFSGTLEYMDLRYNQLSGMEAETASKMFTQRSTRYRLEGNPIMCTCNNWDFIDAMQRYQNQIIDYDNVTCLHGEVIKYVSINTLCLKERAPVISGIFGSIAILSLVAFALYYRYHHQIHVMLYAWCLCSCCTTENELDKDKTYDVFVSYAYKDSTFVIDEVLPGLEKEPHAFKVCIHYRDWTVGEWIPTQIAQSVKDSRRTIIVLSKNFLSSIWALLEFRTAHTQAMKDGRARLILVLLEDLEDVVNHSMMDDELRGYLSSNTYIRWGDPMFWNKLRYALPHRRRAERRLQAAAEEVVTLMRTSDPPMDWRNSALQKTLPLQAAPKI